MKNQNLILLIGLFIICVLIGGFYYLIQIHNQGHIDQQLNIDQQYEIMPDKKSININNSNNEDQSNFEKKIECYGLKEEIEKKINQYNNSQSPELRVVDRGVREEYMCYEQKESKDVFYSDILDSCLNVEIVRTICKSFHPEASGNYYINYETYYLYDILKSKQIDFNNGLSFMYTIFRGHFRHSEYEVMELINEYK